MDIGAIVIIASQIILRLVSPVLRYILKCCAIYSSTYFKDFCTENQWEWLGGGLPRKIVSRM